MAEDIGQSVARLREALAALPPPVLVESLRYVSTRPLAQKHANDANQLATMLVREAWEIGTEQFVGRLKKATKKALSAAFANEDEADDEDQEYNLTTDPLERLLKRACTGSNPEATFGHVRAELVRLCAADLMIDTSEGPETLQYQLVDETLCMGVDTLFSLLPRSLLIKFFDNWSLEPKGGKRSLVSQILMHLLQLDLDDMVIDADDADEEQEFVDVTTKNNDVMETEKKREEKKSTKTKPAPPSSGKNAKTQIQEDSTSDSEDGEHRDEVASKSTTTKHKLAHKAAADASAKTKVISKAAAESKKAVSPRPLPKKKEKKTLQLPNDMKDLSADWNHGQIMRKYKVDQLKRCLKMNGLDDTGLKAKLASRLLEYLEQLADAGEDPEAGDAEEEDDENADPNTR